MFHLDLVYSLYVNTKRKLARLDMRGNFVDTKEITFVTDEWEILGTGIITELYVSRRYVHFNPHSYENSGQRFLSLNLLDWLHKRSTTSFNHLHRVGKCCQR